MKEIKNEKGIALITAILTIVVFSILGLAIVTMTNQGQKQRDLSNEQIEGKMLADTGLLYFQKYLEKNLNFNDPAIHSAIKSPNDDDALMEAIKKIYPSSDNQIISLPDGKGAFQIQYQIAALKKKENNTDILVSAFPYQEDNDASESYSQPYVRKLKVTIIGIPADTSHFKRVWLNATVYINTIASPFHYAISTPNELHLFGGSNIIGNVTANQVYVSTEYYHSSYDSLLNQDVYTIEPDEPSNQPYIEGKVFLNGNSPGLYKIQTFQTNSKGHPVWDPSTTTPINTDRQSLQNLFTPKGDAVETGLVSAPSNNPYIPGTEPPLFETANGTTNHGLGFTSTSMDLKDYIKSQFPSHADITLNDTSTPLWIGANEVNAANSDFTTNSTFPSSDAVIYTNQSNVKSTDDNASPFLLTARLTGNGLPSSKRLFVGPNPTSANYDTMIADVEMGESGSFNNPPDYTSNDPFTFNGPIFIKGNLDIVGDINVNGTIYVDGDVNIRDLGGGTDISNTPNLVILSTGKITISNRANDWSKILSVFLYSENHPIEIYSNTSVNRFYGGVATGAGNDPLNPPYIEFNTKREGEQNSYASHMTIQFNRGIFEKETPGLPSANQFFFDTYDLNYSLDN